MRWMISFIALEPAANVSRASSHTVPASRRDLSSPRTSSATRRLLCLTLGVLRLGKVLLSDHDCARDGFQLKVSPEHSFDDAVESLARFGVARMCREANAPHFAIILRTCGGYPVMLFLKLTQGALRSLDGILIGSPCIPGHLGPP